MASSAYTSPIFRFDEAAHQSGLQEAEDMHAVLEGRQVCCWVHGRRWLCGRLCDYAGGALCAVVGLLVCGASGSGAAQTALPRDASGTRQATGVLGYELLCRESCMPPLQAGLLLVKPSH